MIPRARTLLCWPLFLALLPTLAIADESGLRLTLAPERVRQGGVVTLRVQSPTPLRSLRVWAGDRDVPVALGSGRVRGLAWIGVDLDHPPGPLTIRVEAEEETGRPRAARGSLVVLDGRFPIQRLSVPRPFVELDAATLERVAREKALLDRLWETLTARPLWRNPFRLPLEGEVSASGFGQRRIVNGEPRAPHSGADFAAPAGAPVLAANSGSVVLAEEHFFAGKSLIVDHGLGLFTMYFHLQETLVQPGRRVERGELVARVGSTGRATGPHLHWGARLPGARIDPMALLALPAPQD